MERANPRAGNRAVEETRQVGREVYLLDVYRGEATGAHPQGGRQGGANEVSAKGKRDGKGRGGSEGRSESGASGRDHQKREGKAEARGIGESGNGTSDLPPSPSKALEHMALA